MVLIEPYHDGHTHGITALCEAEGWPTFTDPDRVRKLFTAPGVVGLAAVDDDARVAGAVHVLSDGYHSYLNVVIVAADRRGRGIGRELVAAALAASGAVRMDLLSLPGSEGFYRTWPHRSFSGFRIYPPSAVQAG